MSKRLVLEPLKDGKWCLEHDYTVELENVKLTVPRGFITDLASIPKLLWSFLPPFGAWTKGSVVHDYIWESGILTLKEADDIFLEMMLKEGATKWKADLIYYSVRAYAIWWNLKKK